jgi:tryptophan synthase beta chain
MFTKNQINNHGYFGEYGGAAVPPPLVPIMDELSRVYEEAMQDTKFRGELQQLYKEYVGRPSMLYFAARMTQDLGGPQIYLKREDLNHTGAHKINNVIGQGLLAKRMGKKKLIAETGAGQHGVATATIAAYLGMSCDIYMGERDIKSQGPNIYRMKILGARVIPFTRGQGTLKDAVDEALEAYVSECNNAYYLLGSVVGPHPYPTMVRDFQKIIGEETRAQLKSRGLGLPRAVVACVGGGSNALGAMYDFIRESSVELVAVEPAGKGADTKKHGLSLRKGKPAMIHGYKTLALVDSEGKIMQSYSAASGLDYPGVGPELAYLKDQGRLTLAHATDQEAVDAFVYLARTEGIIPALESAHAISYIRTHHKRYSRDDIVVINLSGRGDKDVEHVYEEYLSE